MLGQVIAVTEHIAGSELVQAPASGSLFTSPNLYTSPNLFTAGPGQLDVVDGDEFDHDGGKLKIGNESGNYVVPQDVAEDGSGVLDLDFTLSGSYGAGEPVYEINPDGSLRKERWADVIEPDGEEVLRVRVPHTLYAMLPLGNRDPEIDVAEVVTFANDGTDLVITDVIGKASSYNAEDEDGLAATFSADTGLEFAVDSAQGASPAKNIVWRAATGEQIIGAYVGVNGNNLFLLAQDDIAGQANATLKAQAGSNVGNLTFAVPGGAAGTLALTAGLNGAIVNIISRDSGGNKTSDFELATSGGWQGWVPTLTGYSADPTNAVYRYKQVGKLVTVNIAQGTAGTSNAATKTISLPVTAKTVTNGRWEAAARVMDNGAVLTAPGLASVMSGDTVVSFGKDWSSLGGFTASGSHRIVSCQMVYEAA